MRNTALVGCGDVAIVHWEALAALGDELGIRRPPGPSPLRPGHEHTEA